MDQSFNSPTHIVNQQNAKIRKIGMVRLRSLELFHGILVLLFPTFGPLAAAQMSLQG